MPTPFYSDAMVREIIEAMRSPRLICICGEFFTDYQDRDLDFTRCGNCSGWMSEERIVNDDIGLESQEKTFTSLVELIGICGN